MEEASVRTASPTVANLVIGGGLAGSMVAIRLAATGRQVTLLEKESAAHHKVCGEFLSPEAVEYLNQVGINPLDLGAATIRFVRLSSKQRAVETACPSPRYRFHDSLWMKPCSHALKKEDAKCSVARSWNN